MNLQIKNIIQRLSFSEPGVVAMDLSAPQTSPLGGLLWKLFYKTQVLELLDRDQTSGYPHNGGVHSLRFRGPCGDAVAFLELIKETLTEGFKLPEEQSEVANQLSYVSQEILAYQSKSRHLCLNPVTK